jgi:hypothetical protein
VETFDLNPQVEAEMELMKKEKQQQQSQQTVPDSPSKRQKLE